jgi:hypothetical protein
MAEGMMGCRREDPEQGADVVIQMRGTEEVREISL